MSKNQELTIGGYTIEQLAEEWVSYLKSNITDAVKYNREDEDFLDDIKSGIPAEILNTAEQDAWETLRSEFSAFAGGDWSAAEDEISEKVISLKEAVDYDSIVAEAIK